jgi:hypothetical protein
MNSNELVYIFIIIFLIGLFILIVRYLCIKRLKSNSELESNSEYEEISSEDSVVIDILVLEKKNCVVLNCNHILHKKCLEDLKKSSLEFKCLYVERR